MLIGVSGYARSGKDSFADALCASVPWSKKVAFADKLRELTMAIYPDTNALVTARGWDQAKSVSTTRERLQLLGETCRRVLGQDVWVDALLREINPRQFTVVSDVRYRNEAQAIRRRGGVLIRIERPGVGPINEHISEHDLDGWTDWDAIIHNDGNLQKLDRIAQEWGRRAGRPQHNKAHIRGAINRTVGIGI